MPEGKAAELPDPQPWCNPPGRGAGARPTTRTGDELVDAAVFEIATGNWHILPSGGGPTQVITFGISSDRPVPGDYDGDGRTDVAVFRPTERDLVHPPLGRRAGSHRDLGRWYRPALVPADYDGDRRTDFTVFRPSTGRWTRAPERERRDDGRPSSAPRRTGSVPGDYDGDGRTDVAVFRPEDGNWYVHPSVGGGDIVTITRAKRFEAPGPAGSAMVTRSQSASRLSTSGVPAALVKSSGDGPNCGV